jgi:FtsP/CotA-like multicopper oxidase with cupredoxin domain
MLQPAASLWFHPHPDMKTGEQVYRGLAGVYLLSDAISEQLETAKQLPMGNFDIPMLIQDRRFNAENNGVRELAYKTMNIDNDGMLGDTILVNGAVLPKLAVETRQYRFRIYNTSNARTYDFALSDGKKFKVVGTDGGLLASPVEVDHIMLGAAERAEVVIDFSQYGVNDKVMLVSKAFNGGIMDAMMEGIDSDMSGGIIEGMLANGMYLDIMRFDIATAATDDVTLYSALPSNAEIYSRSTASQSDNTRNFVMTMLIGNEGMDAGNAGMGNGNNGINSGNDALMNMSFVINGKTFDMNRIDEVIDLSTLANNTEIWSIQNLSPMAHPFHAHAIQWQILDRDSVPATGIDLGWKDTVLVQSGETVNFIGRFDPVVNKGDYMYHCHILEHEDAGMMGFFKIK